MKPSISVKTSRRSLLTGAAATVGTLASSPTLAALFANGLTGDVIAKHPTISKLKRYKPVDLKAYHCSLVHRAIGEKLGRTISDPSISSKQTAMAIRTSNCPCCGIGIGAIMPDEPVKA